METAEEFRLVWKQINRFVGETSVEVLVYNYLCILLQIVPVLNLNMPLLDFPFSCERERGMH